MELPTPQHTTSAAIVRWYESKPQEHRPHLGASIIGHECSRYIWNTFRWARPPKFPGRILRLFDTGKREEARLLEELQGIGAKVWATDPQTGDQFRVTACAGHFGGSLDGVAQGVPESKAPCVLEFKTHNHKSFTALISKGVQASKPQHYAQMQVYMHLMDLDRALYLAVNKDNDDVHSEWVHYDRDAAVALLERAQRLIDATEPPEKIAESKDKFPCKMCSFAEHCHGEVAAAHNCRTCCHSTPLDGGAWKCEAKQVTLTHEDQLAGCTLHLMIPALVTYATPVDGGEGWVRYKHNAQGVEFINGNYPGADVAVFSSRELEHSPADLMPQVTQIKKAFDGVVDPFADFVGDHPDDIPVKVEPAKQAAKREKIRQSAKAMKGFA